MNDRLKFRVWDKEQNKYLSLVSRGEDIDFWISIDNTGVYIVERDNNRDVAFFNDITENVIIQQCTGLKNKIGTLIYEGDIVKSAKNPEFVYRVEYDDEHFASFVLISVSRLNMFKHYFGEAMDAEDCIVIGNIYENKEVLQ